MSHHNAIKLTGAAPCGLGLGRDAPADGFAANARPAGAVRRGELEARQRARAICLDTLDRARATGSAGVPAGPSGSQGKNRHAADWPIGMALLSVLVLAAATGVGAAMAPVGSRAGAHPVLAQAAAIPVDTDGYLDGLSRLGVARLPSPSAVPAR